MLRKVILVDDSEHIREGVSQLLRMEGFGVLVAEDGETALEVVDGERYFALITDFQMPGMSGLELIDAFRARGVWFDFIVLISGHPKSELGPGWASYEETVTYVRKPFEADTLIRALTPQAVPKS